MSVKFTKGYSEEYIINMIDDLHEAVEGHREYICDSHPPDDVWWEFRTKIILESKQVCIEEWDR